MDAKLNHSDLSALLAKQAELSGAKAEAFTKAFFDIIIEGLEKDGLVKINGLGTFKITDVASRESVDVNTGEKIEIKGHRKLTFLPADTLKDKVNQPFAMFEPVEIDENYVEEGEAEPETASEETADEEATAENIVPAVEDAPVEEENAPVTEETVGAESGTAEEPLPVNEKETSTPIVEDDATVAEEAVKKDAVPQTEEVKNTYPVTEEKRPAEEKEERKSSRNIFLYIIPAVIAVAAVLFFIFRPVPAAAPVPEEKPVAAKVEKADSVVAKETVEQPAEPDAEEPYKFEMVEELASRPTRSITLADTLHYSMQGEIATHKVAADETLARIALTYYGDRKLWPYIVTFNGLANPNELCKGMELKIPRLQPMGK